MDDRTPRTYAKNSPNQVFLVVHMRHASAQLAVNEIGESLVF